MNVMLRHLGCAPQSVEPHHYIALAEMTGIMWHFTDTEFYPTGTIVQLPDDMCMHDSGWVHCLCDKCHVDYWTRSRPGGKVTCPCCESVEEIPLDAVMLKYEGVEDETISEEDEDDLLGGTVEC